jgi:hypothetical protein
LSRPVRLSRRGGELLLRIFEQSRPIIAASVLQDLSSDLPDLIKIGLLQKHDVSRAALVPGDNRPAFRDLTWQAEGNAYGYFDAADGNVVLAPESQVLYSAVLPSWLAWLANSLVLTNAGKPTELVPASAWDIGDLWITGQRRIPIVFARRIQRSATFNALCEALRKRVGRSGGLILTSSRNPLQQDMADPPFMVVPIWGVVTNQPDVLAIDRSLLLSPYTAPRAQRAASKPLELSVDGRQLTINDTVTVYFKSDIHIKLIRALVDRHTSGKRWRATELLSHAGAGASTVARAFGTKKWKLLSPFLTSRDRLWGFDL